LFCLSEKKLSNLKQFSMKKILFIAACVACNFIYAQTIFVRDQTTREGIQNVFITDRNNKLITSDSKGRADISTLDKNDRITVYHPNYNIIQIDVLKIERNEINLSEKTVQLDEVILSANRHEEKKIDIPYTVNVIKQKEIEFGNQPTSADVLQNTGAVFVQKSQGGGGSPVLRGFEANKVLIVVDGVRMNNAIYRGGHLQDVITLDANMLERTEVIFGPASTIYGSDALGGVMHFYTKNAQLSANDSLLFKVNAMTRYASVNSETTGHLDFNLGWKNFASFTNVTYSNFGDLRSGTFKLKGSSDSWDRNFFAKRFGEMDSMVQNPNNNIQVGSGYSQMDFMQRFVIKSSAFLLHNLNLQYSQSSNINRYDRLSEKTGDKFKFAEWYYGPQKRTLVAYSLNYKRNTLLSDDIKFILAYQKLDQDRISRSFGSTQRRTQMEDVAVLSANADVFKRIKQHELRYGLEITANNVESTANNRNILTSVVTPAATRYAPGGNTMNTFGVYVSHSWDISENFVITDGVRFTMNQLESKFTDTTFYKLPLSAKQSNRAFTGNLGFTWKSTNNYKIALLMNTGFRTPNVDDMSKVFESAGNILIVPNLNVKPEYANNFELGISKVLDGRYKFDLTGFYTLLHDALVLADYQFNGADSIWIGGTKNRIQAIQNRDRAKIAGFTAGMQLDFSKLVSFKSVVNYTYGRYTDVRKDTVVPLDHIPPVFGQTSLLIRGRNFDGEFFVRYNGTKQTKDYSVSGEDNKQFSADPVNGYMPAWFTLNLRVGYSITKNFRVNAACENITDNRYRVFASGINAPGRNFIVSLRYKV
jgi:hemoglobin/transferrin/lactoferrin receptor protein